MLILLPTNWTKPVIACFNLFNFFNHNNDNNNNNNFVFVDEVIDWSWGRRRRKGETSAPDFVNNKTQQRKRTPTRPLPNPMVEKARPFYKCGKKLSSYLKEICFWVHSPLDLNLFCLFLLNHFRLVRNVEKTGILILAIFPFIENLLIVKELKTNLVSLISFIGLAPSLLSKVCFSP